MSEMSVMNNNAAQPAAKKGLFARAVAAVNSRTAKALFKGVAVPLALWL
ncbi:conjugal transfer protein TraA, partial [Salmonella enterica subsp. enterica serovar Livingstone]|nr:conjugal transfer protein TraA [Salmonella enterica subsp. enterica serovar Livingstone]